MLDALETEIFIRMVVPPVKPLLGLKDADTEGGGVGAFTVKATVEVTDPASLAAVTVHDVTPSAVVVVGENVRSWPAYGIKFVMLNGIRPLLGPEQLIVKLVGSLRIAAPSVLIRKVTASPRVTVADELPLTVTPNVGTTGQRPG
jgi:hypothetical protein